MKKTILQLSVAVMICVFGIVGIGKAETLYQRYLEVEGRYPTLQERAEKAFECGVVFMVKDYTGSFKQNIELIKCLPEEGMLGANPVTGFKKTLSSSMTSNQTTVPLSSVTTKDSITLTMALLGNEVYLSIEPGASKEEIVRCTVLTSTTFSNCTRGLGFSGTSTSAVTGNNKSHNSGSTVIMSNVQYVYNTTSRANTWTAKQTFTASTTDIYGDINLGAGSTDFDKTIFANNGDTNLPFLQYDEATSKWLIADDGINTFTISDGGSGLNASNTKAIFVTDSLIGINLVVDNGLEFSNGYLTVSTSSTIVLEGGNLAVGTSTAMAWTGEHSFSATTTLATTTIVGDVTINGDVFGASSWFFGDGGDGASTTNATTITTAIISRYSIVPCPLFLIIKHSK